MPAVDPAVRIEPADTGENLRRVRDLFGEYGELLRERHGACCLGDFRRERHGLPGDYALPAGRLLVAVSPAGAVGCVALRPLGHGNCEMKRLYVRPTARGLGLGRRLAQAVIDAAGDLGYGRMRLDTLPRMTEAVALYASLGFRRIEPYGIHPDGAVCMELTLAAHPSGG